LKPSYNFVDDKPALNLLESCSPLLAAGFFI
jgi:hypothetical protein